MKLKTLFKVTVSSVLLCLLLRQVDLGQLLATVRQAQPSWLAGALVFHLVVILLGTARIGMLLSRDGQRKLLFPSLLQIYWIGLFFNLVLPGQVGGDLVKTYKLSRHSKQPVDSATAVVMDRVMGLTSLVFMAGLALVFGRWTADLSVASRAVIILLLSLAVFCFLIFNQEAGRRLGLLTLNSVREVYLGFNAYRRHLRLLGRTFLLSAAANAVAFLGAYCVARAAGIDLPLLYFFVFIPLVTVISVVPVSISGIGLQDGAYVFFLSQMGVSPAQALAASFLSHMVRFGFGLLGGLVYLYDRK